MATNYVDKPVRYNAGSETFVPLAKRRTHGKRQDWPFPDEIEEFVRRINLAGGMDNLNFHDAWRRLQMILRGWSYLPPEPERPSERAMRLSAKKELKHGNDGT